MKLLFLTPRFPWPLIGGDRVKPYYLLSHLAKAHDVTLVSFYQGNKMLPDSDIDKIKNLGVKEVYVVNIDIVKAALRTAALSLFTKNPLEISYYNQPEFGFIVDRLLRKENFDLGFSFFMRTAEYLKGTRIKKILVAEDCRTLYQTRSYEETSNLKQKIVRKFEAVRLKKYEPRIMTYFDAVTFVTNEDIQNIRTMNTGGNYRLLTNGVNLDVYTMPVEPAKRSGILFAGKLDIWANYLMIQQIVNDIFPKVKNKYPAASLKIVGARAPKYVKALIKFPVTLDVNVPSMVPYLQLSQLFIHPHSGGTGIQNKLLEAMACGCPVVTTPTGIQGIPVTHGVDVLIGRNNDELAAHAVTLLENRDYAKEIGDNARKLIEQSFSWESIFKSLDEIIEEVCK